MATDQFYESAVRQAGEPGSVHLADGGTATLCALPLNNFVRSENPVPDNQEICEKCRAWATDLSQVV